MRVKVAVSDEEFEKFKVNLKNNNFTCVCSIDYDNVDMRCLCKNFREAPVGTLCDCKIYYKE